MKVHLLFPDRDFDAKAPPPIQCAEVAQDLELDVLLTAMAAGDTYLLDVATRVLLAAAGPGDACVVAYRQAALRDTLGNAAEVRALYALVVESIESRKKHLFGLGLFEHHPSLTLHGAIELLKTFTGYLRRLRQQVDRISAGFASEAFGALFSSLQREVGDDYFAQTQRHLETLRFRHGVVLSARLGPGNAGSNDVLHAGDTERPGWLARLLRRAPAEFTFRLPERDEAGARALSELVDRGINDVANALAQATEHVLGFFEVLRFELAFHVACLNLHDRLDELAVATCVPRFGLPGSRRLCFAALRDPTLALTLRRAPVSNDLEADGKGLIVVTGANQGGKSTFLRSLGLAQLMLHAGMFVAAQSYVGTLATGVFTHFKREEDARLQGGKLDEELVRMSAIADAIATGAVWLSNESFASTNEREGSQLLLEVVGALRDKGIEVWLVTHLFDAARRLAGSARGDAVFLRAERGDDGTRSFRLTPGEPLQTSFGADLYAEVFGPDAEARDAAPAEVASPQAPA